MSEPELMNASISNLNRQGRRNGTRNRHSLASIAALVREVNERLDVIVERLDEIKAQAAAGDCCCQMKIGGCD